MNERFGIAATLLQQIRNVDEATGLSEVSGDVCPGDLFVACSQNKSSVSNILPRQHKPAQLA